MHDGLVFKLKLSSKCFVYMSLFSLQQNASMYTKWFHWILSELIGLIEWDLVKCNEFFGPLNGD
jgi:hypothetical protein